MSSAEEERVDNSRAIAATIIGAVLGAAAGYLFFTEQGRRVRRQIEPTLDDIARELISFRATMQKAAGVANEGWKLLNDVLNESSPRPHYPGTHQNAPF
jgi:gas vesicle protein